MSNAIHASTVQLTPAPQAQSAVGSQAEHLTLMFLLQLIVIFSVSRLIAWFSTRSLGQTPVAGEILAGLVLGPSLLGYFFPEQLAALFVPQTATAFVVTAQIGLILLMFQVGLEFEFGTHLKGRKRSVIVISMGGLLVPFASGMLTAEYFWQQISGDKPSLLAFQLFFATALSITALPSWDGYSWSLAYPALGRHAHHWRGSNRRCMRLADPGRRHFVDRLAVQPLDLSGEVAGASVVLRRRDRLIRPLVLRWIIGDLQRRPLSTQGISLMLIILLTSATVTNLIGVFSIIGGFILGVALHTQRTFVEQWNAKVSGVSMRSSCRSSLPIRACAPILAPLRATPLCGTAC